MSQKAARGTKRTCQGCGARFYDLENVPIICPMCEAEFKLTPAEVKDEETETEENEPSVAAAAVPADSGDADEDADELADIETDDDVTIPADDNTVIEDDEDPNASVKAIVPVKPGDDDN